jgi:hypothetical protein
VHLRVKERGRQKPGDDGDGKTNDGGGPDKLEINPWTEGCELTKQLLELTAEDEEPKVTDEATAMEWNTWAAGKTSIKALDATTTEHIGAPKFGTRAQKCERLMRWAVVECS